MAKVGGVVIAPIKRTMFGWRYLESIEISLLNYDISYSLILGLKTFLMATSSPQKVPLWMVLNPPIEICSPICRSDCLIYNTPFLKIFYGYLSNGALCSALLLIFFSTLNIF